VFQQYWLFDHVAREECAPMRLPPPFATPGVKPRPAVAVRGATTGRGFPPSTLALAICVVLAASAAFGQYDSGRGGGRGRNRGTSGQDPGGRSARFETLLRDMDANQNGMIDADEVGSGPRKAFLERMFSRVGVEPSYPLAISKVVQAAADFEASRGSGRRSGNRDAQPPSSNTPTTDASRVRPEFQFGTPAPAISASPGAIPSSTTVVVPGPSTPSTDAAKSSDPASSGADKSSGSADAAKGGESSGASSDSSKTVVKKSLRAKTPKERLPKNLPDWFLQKADADGQIPMAAFTDDWTPAATARFESLDLNHDGIITAAECLKGEKRSGRDSK
jgi:hypothetical protein